MRVFTIGLLGLFALASAACDGDGELASCDGVTCSGNGTCAVAGSEAFCVCNPGFGRVGQECVPCADITAANAHDIVVPAVRISGSFTVADAAPPESPTDSGDIWLESAEQGRVRLGATHEQIFTVRILPGTYSVFYSLVSGGNQVPRNTHAQIGTLEIYENTSTTIDVPTASINGAMSLNGGAFPASDYEDGLIVLVNSDTDDEAMLGNTHDGDYSARVVPGSYEIRYRLQTGGAVAPANSNALVDGASISANGGQFDVDVVSAGVSGDFLLNGGAFPVSEYEDGNLYLATADGQDLVALGNTHDGSFEAQIVTGSYDIYYQLETGGAQVPSNQWGHVGTTNVAVNTNTLDINVQSFALGGAITIDGNTPPLSEYDDGLVWLRTEQDAVFLANTHTPSIGLQVVAGTYDITYQLQTPGDVVPINAGSHFSEKMVASNDSVFLIDIPTGDVSGDIRFNGAPAPQSEYDDGHIVAQNNQTGDRAVLANSHDQQIAVPLVRGVYDLYFEVETPGDVTASNHHAHIGTLDVDGASVDQQVSVTVGPVSGELRLNGNEPPDSEYDDGTVFVRDLAGDDYAELANTHEGVYETRLVGGEYNVHYSVETAGGLVPENVDGRIGCFAVNPLF